MENIYNRYEQSSKRRFEDRSAAAAAEMESELILIRKSRKLRKREVFPFN